MKKMFSIFLLFATFSIVSCGGLLGDDGSKSTVRFTLPADGRSASAGGAGDVDYYNVYIARQSFTNVRGGSTVESSPLPVGTEVSVSAEAIGSIKDGSGNTVASGRRVAYYQTTQRLPASGLTLNVNMANYKTEYHKVTLEAGDFDRVSEEVYVADGSSYILPNYGIYTPTTGANGGVPLKHTGWKMYGTGSDTPPVYPVGASVTITGDRQFELQYAEGKQIGVKNALITWHDDTIYEVPSNSGGDPKYYAWLDESLTLPRGTKIDSGDEVTAWAYESPRSGGGSLGSPGSSLDFSQWTILTAGYSLTPY